MTIVDRMNDTVLQIQMYRYGSMLADEIIGFGTDNWRTNGGFFDKFEYEFCQNYIGAHYEELVYSKTDTEIFEEFARYFIKKWYINIPEDCKRACNYNPQVLNELEDIVREMLYSNVIWIVRNFIENGKSSKSKEGSWDWWWAGFENFNPKPWIIPAWWEEIY